MAQTAQQFRAIDQKILEEPMLSVPKGIRPTGIDTFIYPIKLNLIGAQKLHIQGRRLMMIRLLADDENKYKEELEKAGFAPYTRKNQHIFPYVNPKSDLCK
ncbi:PREDICTED: uncharacterized protein LOC108362592 [Rhagoletis zephyria]|uniref:uncharacterized protein LOC108362592 n=1 Tax=Rhagoletis zephyria TaxID=28612 RepID=UPI0008116437|nr:PREDICTED: uncharacterized protein LOC108362592 [Rhagoletis zephyria]